MSEYTICGVDLDDIHTVLLELLDEVDHICNENNIKYFLSGGTLLGAARHKGFIPWDDDIDLWMTRENYDKFKALLPTVLSDKYFVEDYFENLECPLSIMKIEKRGTRFVEGIFANTNVGHAMYIDIFPLDNIWKPAYRLQTAILIKMQSVRDFHLRGNGKEGVTGPKKWIYSCISLKMCRWITERTMRLFNRFNTEYVNQLSHRGRYWPKFKRSEIEDLVTAEFCGKQYPVPREMDKILTQCYGDYMKMPPKEHQQPTHDIVACSLEYSEVQK